MDTESRINEHLDKHEGEKWLDHSDGYQMLLEACGDQLLPGLFRLTKHPLPEVRAVVVSLLATRRPHTDEMIEAIAPLLNDPDPLVRIKALTHLPDFGQMASSLAVDAYALVVAEKDSDDQLPRVKAIAFLLSLDFQKWEFLIYELHEIVERDKSDMAEFAAMRFLIDHYGIMESLENESGHGEEVLDP